MCVSVTNRLIASCRSSFCRVVFRFTLVSWTMGLPPGGILARRDSDPRGGHDLLLAQRVVDRVAGGDFFEIVFRLRVVGPYNLVHVAEVVVEDHGRSELK